MWMLSPTVTYFIDVFLGTLLSHSRPQFPCLENVVNSSSLTGCLLRPRAGKGGCSYDDIMG